MKTMQTPVASQGDLQAPAAVGWTEADFALLTGIAPRRNPYPTGSIQAGLWARGWRTRRSGRPCPVTGRPVDVQIA